MDPITNFISVGQRSEIKLMLMRLVDFLKSRTRSPALFTNLTHGDGTVEANRHRISSLIDTWLLLQDMETSGERNRGLYVLKSRGMAHSNQIREFLFTRQGIELIDVYIGPARVLTGSARVAQEATEEASAVIEKDEAEPKRRELERRTKRRQARIAAMQAELEAEQEELERLGSRQSAQEQARLQVREALGRSRMADTTNDQPAHRAEGDGL